jgi:hypothetical protein
MRESIQRLLDNIKEMVTETKATLCLKLQQLIQLASSGVGHSQV